MNKLKGDSFVGHDTSIFTVQILVNIQIFALVGGNLPLTCPAFKSEHLYNTLINCTIKLI